MAVRLDLKKRVFDILRETPGREMTARELALEIRERHPDKTQAKLERSRALQNEDDLLQQLVAEIGAHKNALRSKYPDIRTVDIRPRRFYYSTSTDAEEAEIISDDMSSDEPPRLVQNAFTEHQLYPSLGTFVFEEFGCYSMRIDEKRSQNRNGSGANRWLFPDVVGVVNLMEGWHTETAELAKTAGAERVQYYSFEVKKRINRSNVRECVFQTVSNSSWANYAYLAAAKLDERASGELRLLCAAHGIGFITIDHENPTESQVTIPARLRDSVEWNALDRLTSENTDAQQYVENVRAFHGVSRIRSRDWDLCPMPDR